MIKIKHLFQISFVLILVVLLFCGFKTKRSSSILINETEFLSLSSQPSCLKMYFSIEKYADKYGVPKRYVYGIAYNETKYGGPLQFDYDHKQISKSGALGPMQVLLSTARWIWDDDKITKKKLLNDVDFNVETSIKYLSMLHAKYKDWKIAFAYYNTGYPKINSYAMRVYTHKT